MKGGRLGKHVAPTMSTGRRDGRCRSTADEAGRFIAIEVRSPPCPLRSRSMVMPVVTRRRPESRELLKGSRARRRRLRNQ